jgi:hypothetical protein
MFDYSIYEKSDRPAFTMDNPKKVPRRKPIPERLCIQVFLLRRSVKIIVHHDISLDDLYLCIYNAVYPEFSTEKLGYTDEIPPPDGKSITHVPLLYYLSVASPTDEIIPVPNHKFITLSSFMEARKECFRNRAFLGIPTYSMYALDEAALSEFMHSEPEKKRGWFMCLGR